MIQVGISGGDSLFAGELLRILINHPDVHIRWITGQCEHARVTTVHRGLIGECDLCFSGKNARLEKTDVVMLCDPADRDYWTRVQEENPAIKLIDLTAVSVGNPLFTYGLSEVNRKFMVHDCYRVVNPSPQAHAILLALLPLAKNLLLNGDMDVKLSHRPLCEPAYPQPVTDEVTAVLSALQSSFSSAINVQRLSSTGVRSLSVQIVTKCSVDLATISQIYEDYYDDHNFVFLCDKTPAPAEVENTCKCLLHLSREDNKLVISSVLDPVVKGSAGNAVHVMNLLFGLHERVGLALKATGF